MSHTQLDRVGHLARLTLATMAFMAMVPSAFAQAPLRKIGEMELRLMGVSATVDPPHPVVPRNIPSAVRIVVGAGGVPMPLADALRFLGPMVEVKGELSGPGLSQTVSLPVRAPEDPLPADPFLLPLPGLTVSGNYTLANLRIESGGRSVLDVTPATVTIEVIEQVLVTSVKTRALTLDEIKEKGIVLDSDDYLGFEFTMGLKLESQPVNLTFPVVFDREGVAVPEPLLPPPPPPRQGVSMPTVVPLLLEPEPLPDDGSGAPAPRVTIRLPTGEPVRIPAVLVIPGNVGYLKQFFSAQLFVANGAPAGSGLFLRNVTGTARLPPGADLELGTDDDPLALPETVRGPQPETMPVLGLGPDGKIGTGDDDVRFSPGEQGEAEFLLRGEREGFHPLSFDIAATLEGLVSGPVGIKGKASGGVLVRNPFFDMTFTVPATVRRNETFKLYASVTNIGQGLANDVTVSLDAAAISGCRLLSDATVHVDTIAPGDSKTVAFEFESQRTGQVVASYLKLEGAGHSGGNLRFSLGVGERGVPLSPDTLVLPAAVDSVPQAVVDAAMRVLGQAWSIANAPTGTLPRGVLRTSKTVVVAKALALAEAGLRISLGQDVQGSLEALDYDFFAGAPRDPGFDQLLRDTEAGRDLRRVFGGPAPTQEPLAAGGPAPVAAAVIGPEVLSGAGPFGLHAILVFDRILDDASAAEAARYEVPNNAVRSAKAVLSGRLVVVNLARPEGPYVPTTIGVRDLLDRAGRRGSGSVPLTSRLEDPGAVVSGRVITADGAAVPTANVVYTNNTDLTCYRPAQTGLSTQPVDGDGRFEYRYVRRDHCGQAFEMVTQDPATGAQRKSSGFVRAGGERIVLDIVLMGRGAVEGTVRDLQDRPVAGASVVVLSQTDPQSGGQATTNAAGHYRVEGITVGPVSVKAGKGIVIGHSAGRLDRAGTTATVNVVLDGGAVKVSGTVRKIEGGVETVVPGIYVFYAIDPDPYPTTVGYARSGPDGRFQLTDMPAGFVQLSARLDTGESASTSFFTTAAGDNLTGKDLLFQIASPAQTGSVEGVVLLPDGSGAAQAIVRVGTRGVRADDSGAFRIDGVEVIPNASRTVDATSRDGRRRGSSSFILNSPGQVAPAVIRLSGIGSVTFTVQDPTGAVLAGQDVAVMRACGNPCGCDLKTTDASGQARWDGVGVGSFEVQAIREVGGNYEAARGIASVTHDGETAFGAVRFLGTGTVSGIVLDPTTAEGRPSFGADVRLSSNHFVYDPSQFLCGMVQGPSHSARTGTDGRFRFTGVGMGPLNASAQQEFFPTPVGANGQMTHDGQEVPLTLRLVSTTAGILSGTVFLPDGVTPAGRGVQVTATGALPDVVVETNDQGRFRFARIFPQGFYRLTASDPATGGVSQTQVYLQAGQDLVNDLRLKGRGTVRVAVVDGLSNPVENAYVKLQESEFPRRSYEGAADPSNHGVVVFDGVYEGPFSVEAADVFARGGRASASMPRAGQVVDVTVRVTTTGRVTGRFLKQDQTTPIPNGVVKLIVSSRVLGQVTTPGAGPDLGRFSFDYVPAGPVRLEAEDPLTGRTGVAVGTIETEAQALSLDVFAQAIGRVTGTVTSNGTLQPLAFVDVLSGSFKAATQTDAQGDYLVDGVPEGQVKVQASLAQGFLQGTSVGNLQGEGQTLDLDVALRGSGRVKGQVLAADNVTPAPTSQVRVSVGGQGGGSLSAVTDGEGRFVFERVPAGQAYVQADVVSSIDGASASVVVPEAGEVDVPLRLNGLGNVRGETFDSGGAPVAGFVSISGPKGALFVSVGEGGTFEVRDLLAGPYTAQLRVPNGGLTLFGNQAFEVLPGETATLRLQLQPSGSVTGVVRRPGNVAPAFGTEVTLRVSANGSELVAQAQADGAFTFRGVPLGAFSLRARDAITGGLAVLSGHSVVSNGQVVDVGVLVLDATAPVLVPVQPVPGSVRAAFAGPLVLDVTDEGAGLDTATLTMVPGGVAFLPFTFADNRATTTLSTAMLTVGENRLVAQVKDLAGNVSTTEWRFTVTGGVLRGSVRRADGSIGGAVPLRLDGVVKPAADADGNFVFTGLRPGFHTIEGTDPATGLTSWMQVALGDGEDLTIAEPLRLPAFGRITGVVRQAGNTLPAVGVTVQVQARSAVTGTDGAFDLGPFPLGSYGLSATGADGDRGDGTAVLTALGQTVSVPITLNGLGRVEVVLRDAGGDLVAGASVVVTSSSPYGAGRSGTTGPGGAPAVFTGVFAGTITARATHPASGLVGETQGVLQPAGLLQLSANLQPSGRVAGVVSRREGGPAAGVEVRMTHPRSLTRTTDAAGAFAFEDVPLGSWGLTASDPATQDVGQASGTLSEAGATANGNITLNGVGTVRVSVVDAASQAVAGASVSVSSSAGRGYFGTSGLDGVATFANVLAGTITATSTHPTNGTRGSDTGTLTAAGSLDLLTRLQATGTLTGVVFAPDGETPFAGAVVTATGPAVTTGPDGVYEFRDVVVGTYTVSASVGGRQRAQGTSVLANNGDVATRNLVLVPVAPVSGHVTQASGAPAVSARMALYSAAPTFGGYFEATTNGAGDYTIADVPVGAFTIGASLGADRADATGTVVTNGVGVTVNLDLLSSAVALPINLTNGNQFQWQVAKDGSLSHGTIANAPEYVGRLEVSRGGTTTAFAGPDCPFGQPCSAATEEGKREVVLVEPGLLGLDAVRKVFVASDGYFVRQLDLLRNPGPDPVTFDVRLVSHFGASTLQATSSGDAAYTTADHWLTVDDADTADPYDSPTGYWAFWPVGITTAGAGAQTPSSVSSASAGDGGRLVSETWSSITLAPGESFGLLRFYAAQNDRERARASVERLSGLPPEALVGLIPEEAGAVRNFVVPADLTSAVAPLPPNDGRIDGRVLAGDGQTSAGSRSVVFRSRSLYHGRPVNVGSVNAGPFQVTPSSIDVVPRMAFDLTSSATVLGETMTASASGDFALDGEGRPVAAATADLVFAGSGALEVAVSRPDGSPVANTNIHLDRAPQSHYSGATNAVGRLVVPLLTPGPVQIRVSIFGGPEVSAPATVVANQLTTAPVILADFGAVTGTLRTAAGLAVSSYVSITAPSFSRRVLAAVDGGFTLTDVPFGAYTLTAEDTYRSAATSSMPIVVGAVTDPVNISLPPVGRVNVTARIGTPTGPPLAGAYVYWKSDSRGPDYVYNGPADSIGRGTINYVSGPQFRVKVEYPGASLSFTETPLATIAEGQVIDLPVVVPGVVTVTGTLRSRDGLPMANSLVQAYAGSSSTLVAQLGTGASGSFSFANVPVGALRLRGECSFSHAFTSLLGRAEVELTASTHGDTITEDALCPLGSIAATRRRDFWRFTAAAGSTIGLTLAPGATGPLVDPYLEVFGPDGLLAAANDNRNVNDKAAAVSLTTTSAGTYVVVARAAAAESGTYRLGGAFVSENPILSTFEPPRVVGTVTKDWISLPAAGHPVRLLSGATVVEATTAGADGSFSLGVFPLGAFTLEATDGEGVVVARATGSAATPGTSLTQNLVVPVRGTVSVTVRRGPQTLAGVTVTLSSDHAGALDEDRNRSRTTDANGTASTTLPAGAVTSRAIDPLYGGAYEATGTLADGGSLGLEIVLPENPTRLFGIVRSGNGEVALPGALVIVSGPTTLQSTTNAAGQYEIPAVPPGAYTLTASLGGGSVSQPLTLTGGERQADLRITLPVIVGTVREADGSTPARARVEACQGTLCLSQDTAANGSYGFFGGFPAWMTGGYVYLRAWPLDNPNLVTSSFYVYIGAAVETVNLTLSPSRAVFGTVLGPGGPTAATVRLRDAYGYVYRQTTGPDGAYRFGHVFPYAGVDLYAVGLADGLPGHVASDDVAPELQIDIPLSAAATFAGDLRDTEGQAIGGTSIVFVGVGSVAEDGYSPWRVTIPVDEAGHFAATVPAGPFRAYYDSYGCAPSEPSRRLLAVGDGYLAAGANPSYPLTLGEGATYPSVIGGPLGTYGGHRNTHDSCSQTSGDTGLDADLWQYEYGDQSDEIGRISPDGRRVTKLLARANGLDVRQEQFVPVSGAFVRHILWLSNPGTSSITLDVPIRAEFGDRIGWRLRGDSSLDSVLDANDRWAWASVDELEADSFGGPAREAGAAFGTGALAIEFYEGASGEGFQPGSLQATFAVTVPPGTRLGLMSFAVGRLTGFGTPGALATLADLSHPEALVGLSQDDRQAIVNFAVPETPAAATGVEGIVVRDGAPVSNAPVAAVDVADGVVLARDTSDASGHFVLRGVRPGPVQVAAVDPGTSRPGAVAVTVVTDVLTPAEVVISSAGDMGQVRGVVRYSTGEPLGGAAVLVESADYPFLWKAEVTADAQGEYQVSAPAGGVRARLRGRPSSLRTDTLAPGGTAVIDLEGPAGAAFEGNVRLEGMVVPNAIVAAIPSGTEQIAGQTSTDEAGYFLLRGLPGGDYRIVAVDPITNRPGLNYASATSGQTWGIDIDLLTADSLGPIHGTVRNGSGDPVADVRVRVRTPDFSPLWSSEATTGSNGEYSLVAPFGTVILGVNGNPSTEIWYWHQSDLNGPFDIWLP